MIYTDWPLLYLSFLIACAGFWMAVGIVIMCQNIVALRADVARYKKLMEDEEWKI